MITGLELAFLAQLGMGGLTAEPVSMAVVKDTMPWHETTPSKNTHQILDIISCDPQDMTKINVIWETDEINYDYSKSMNQLSNMPIDTKSPYAAHVVTKVGGLMKGGLEVTTNYKVAKARYEILRKNCLWLSEIDIRIKINPTIFIANEYPPGSCMYDSVKTHELKHIQVDRDIATKYQHYLREMASKVAQKVGVVGPKSDIEARRSEAKIQDYFSQHMNAVLEAMYKERGERQQAVDNIHEYETVQGRCKGKR